MKSNPIDEDLIGRFEAERLSGKAIKIDDCLPPQSDPTYLGTLVELVAIEMEFCWRSVGTTDPTHDPGEGHLVEHYVKRYPELSDPTIMRSLLSQEFHVRGRCDQTLQFDEYHERFPELIQSPEDLPESNTKSNSASAVGELIHGTEIGNYKLLQEVGEGGFGVVYLAEQEQPVRRRVALKVIKAGMDTREVIARFEAERQALAMMEHENVARVFDGGVTETGRPYFVMELIDGIPITEHCDKQKLNIKERLLLFISVCDAIQHAHQKGVIHRDIKPSNVLISFQDGKAVPKVIDFGVAKAIDQRLTEKTIFTAMGQILGTPQYMSPEQAEPNQLDIDTRSDVYSLGILLFELLTGTTPLKPEELRGAIFQEMLRRIREVDPPTPSKRVSESGPAIVGISKSRQTIPEKLGRMVRGDLDWIVVRALEKDRARRYESPGAFAADIQRYLEHEPVEAGPPSSIYRLRRFSRKHRGILITAAAFAAVLIAAASISIAMAIEANRQRDFANASKDEAVSAKNKTEIALRESEQSRKQAEAVSEFMVSVFRKPNPLDDGADYRVVDVLGSAAEELQGARFDDDPITKAALLYAIGDSLTGLGFSRNAIPLALESLKLREQHLPPESPDLLNSLLILAYAYDANGDEAPAIETKESALEWTRKHSEPNSVFSLRTQMSLAESYAAYGQHERALAISDRVMSYLKQSEDEVDEDILTLISKLGSVYFLTRQFDKAVPVLEESLTKHKTFLGQNSTLTMKSMYDLANAYDQVGRGDESLTLRKEAFPLARKVLGEAHPVTLEVASFIAEAMFTSGDAEAALTMQEHTVQQLREHLKTSHPRTFQSIILLAQMYADLGRHKEALVIIQDTLNSARLRYGPTHRYTLLLMSKEASILVALKQFDEAVKLHEQIFEARQSANQPSAPNLRISAMHLAGSYRATNQPEKAITVLESILEIDLADKGPKHPDTLATQYDIADSLQAAGRSEDSLELALETLETRRQVLGETHDDTLKSMHGVAYLYKTLGRPEELISTYQQAIETLQAQFGPTDDRTRAWSQQLATIYASLDQPEKSLELNQRLYQSCRDKLGDHHPETMFALNSLANDQVVIGAYSEAIAMFEILNQRCRSQFGASHPATLNSTFYLAFANERSGAYAKAQQLYTQYVDDSQGKISSSPMLLFARTRRVFCQTKQDDIDVPQADIVWLQSHAKQFPGFFGVEDAKIQLGGVQIGRGEYATAEKMLLEGYEGLNAQRASISSIHRFLIDDALDRIVELYEAWDKPKEAAKWRKIRSESGS